MEAQPQLFEVTNLREYSQRHKERWPGPSSTDHTSKYLVWRVSAEEVIANHDNRWWNDHYRDTIVAVELVDSIRLSEMRSRAQAHPSVCCDLAVLRNCVCSVSFLCPVHGVRCCGSHD